MACLCIQSCCREHLFLIGYGQIDYGQSTLSCLFTVYFLFLLSSISSIALPRSCLQFAFSSITRGNSYCVFFTIMESSTTTGINHLPTELLEMILLQLGMQFLLVTAQRVCQKWTACILCVSGHPIKAFLQELPDSEAAFMNPLLADLFPSFFPFL